jgi:amino acid transporter
LAKPPRKFINLFLLSMLNLSVMASLRNIPIIAEYGWQSAFFYLFVAAIFLFPVSLISAELATGWSKSGGVYVWVKEAFGPGWGFLAIWLQWIHNAAWFPAILSFSATALAYLINPELASNKVFLMSVILIGFWGFTLFNYFGLKTSAWFSTIGVIAGTIIPGLLLIALGLHWTWSGQPMQITYSPEALVPRINGLDDLVFITGLFLAFGGLEVSAAHAKEVKDPQKTFPRAILISAFTALVLYVAGALAIAIMIPKEEINLVAGLMEAFGLFFTNLKLSWAIYPIGFMIILGAIGELNAWIIGPVRALHATSDHGDLPPILQKLNKHQMPANLLFLQAIIVTITSFVFLFMSTPGGAFWILTAMSAQLYLLMYILMFLAAIKLRYSHPEVKRAYRVPFGKPGIWFIGLLGTISSSFAFVLAFFVPKQIEVGNIYFYEGFLMIGIAIMCLVPYIIYKYKAPHWAKKKEIHEKN